MDGLTPVPVSALPPTAPSFDVRGSPDISTKCFVASDENSLSTDCGPPTSPHFGPPASPPSRGLSREAEAPSSSFFQGVAQGGASAGCATGGRDLSAVDRSCVLQDRPSAAVEGDSEGAPAAMNRFEAVSAYSHSRHLPANSQARGCGSRGSVPHTLTTSVSPSALPSPQENPVGYRNLELFVSTLLHQCESAMARQRRASATCLFFALHRAASSSRARLLKWACTRWQVNTSLASFSEGSSSSAYAPLGDRPASALSHLSWKTARPQTDPVDGGLSRMVDERSLSLLVRHFNPDLLSAPRAGASTSSSTAGQLAAPLPRQAAEGAPVLGSKEARRPTPPESVIRDSRDAGKYCSIGKPASVLGAGLVAERALPCVPADSPDRGSLPPRSASIGVQSSVPLASAWSRSWLSARSTSGSSLGGSCSVRSSQALSLGRPTPEDLVLCLLELGDGVPNALAAKLSQGTRKAQRLREAGSGTTDLLNAVASALVRSESEKPVCEAVAPRERAVAPVAANRGGGAPSRGTVPSRHPKNAETCYGTRLEARREVKKLGGGTNRRSGPSAREEQVEARGRVCADAGGRGMGNGASDWIRNTDWSRRDSRLLLPAVAASLLTLDYESFISSTLCGDAPAQGAADSPPSVSTSPT
ncbi:hypothetical protein BESB_053880 [Besnoitia besnoiti]|uniref:Uncharacterized protein n=1 Tax=Besnoitia besnoiti TaxID=94643 RepID=A0A2A9MJG2_BESBE|nr:hypothetical protein BESB_053880 [Besnoitia besnoiti]PFH35737.1 hypothetical protein BESB_053880 [Besnoitia besnoiti]